MPAHNWLTQVKEGMEVYDSNGEKVGEVRTVYLGTTSDEAEAYTADAGGVPDPELVRDDSLIENLAEAFGGDRMPQELRERLLYHGYVQIDTGLLHDDRFAMSDQVESVGEGRVTLNVPGDALAEPT